MYLHASNTFVRMLLHFIPLRMIFNVVFVKIIRLEYAWLNYVSFNLYFS